MMEEYDDDEEGEEEDEEEEEEEEGKVQPGVNGVPAHPAVGQKDVPPAGGGSFLNFSNSLTVTGALSPQPFGLLLRY